MQRVSSIGARRHQIVEAQVDAAYPSPSLLPCPDGAIGVGVVRRLPRVIDDRVVRQSQFERRATRCAGQASSQRVSLTPGRDTPILPIQVHVLSLRAVPTSAGRRRGCCTGCYTRPWRSPSWRTLGGEVIRGRRGRSLASDSLSETFAVASSCTSMLSARLSDPNEFDAPSCGSARHCRCKYCADDSARSATASGCGGGGVRGSRRVVGAAARRNRGNGKAGCRSWRGIRLVRPGRRWRGY